MLLPSHHSLAKWPCFLEEMYRDDRAVTEDSYSISTLRLLYKLRLGASRLLTPCLVQNLSSKKTYRHALGLAGKRRRLGSVSLQLLQACNAVLAHTEEEHPVPVLHVAFAKKERTAQLDGLFTGGRLQGMRKESNYYAVDTVFLFPASFIDRILGIARSCDLTGKTVFYTETATKLRSITMKWRERRKRWRVCD